MTGTQVHTEFIKRTINREKVAASSQLIIISFKKSVYFPTHRIVVTRVVKYPEIGLMNTRVLVATDISS